MPHPPLPRPRPDNYPDDTVEEFRENADGFERPTQALYSSSRDPAQTRPGDQAQEPFSDTDHVLSDRSAITAFQSAVDEARQSIEQCLAGSESIGHAASLKLTVALRNQSLRHIPEEVVEIIRRDVENLDLRHNKISQVPYNFERCEVLKYLSLRGNRFTEFPKAVFKLPQLEIFDISRNKLRVIPDEVRGMRALRALSVSNNNIENVSPILAAMDNVTILKMNGNPLHPDLKRIADENASPLELDYPMDKKRDVDMTKKLKTYLRTTESAAHNADEDSSSDVGTPRAPRRNPSTRFPVKPHVSESESLSDINSRSPGFAKPPIPMRSHYRIPSGQNELLYGARSAALRRPGLAPLANGNERNRSNSESILQATQNNRSKRMGMVKKKSSGLGKVEETYINRNSSHFRGQSDGSALHDRSNAGMKSSEINLPSPLIAEGQNGTFVRRLSSLPEHKRDSSSPNCMVEGAKGVLYSLHQVHQHVSALIPIVKDPKKSNLEALYFCAMNQLDDLDRALHSFQESPGQAQDQSRVWINAHIAGATEAAIVAYQQVGERLQQGIARLVSGGDQRYIRTMMLSLYGSSIEARNACWNLSPFAATHHDSSVADPQIPTISERRLERHDRSLTPTKNRPNPERRWRNGIAGIQTGYFTPSSSGAQTAVPLYVNGRSRSGSRTGPFPSSSTSSIANTPRSGESFKVTGTPQIRSRSNSALGQYINSTNHLLDSPEHDAHFEKIYNCLTRTIDLGQVAVPKVLKHASCCLDVAQTSERNKRFVSLWSALIMRSKHCLEMCEILKKRLKTVKLNDPDVRYARDFWRLSTKLFDAVTKLLDGIKEARSLDLIATDMIMTIQPILKAAREASHLVHTSPWAHLIESETPERVQDTTMRTPNGVQAHDFSYQQQQQSYRYRSRTGSGNSPYLTNVPATPLSAALGPAVQATVPTSASLDRSFQGDVFQRASELLRVQQTIVPRR